MYFTWQKGQFKQLSKNFNSYEFECPCVNISCIEQKISKDLVDNLQKLRDDVQDVVSVTSAYRCPAYQQELTQRGYKTAKNSQHVLGNAADIVSRNMYALGAAVFKYFRAVGTAKNFFHVDERRDKDRTWTY